MRNLDLYIRNQKVELSEDNLILLNYTFEEIGQPAIVKNSFVKKITLAGTPTNDDVFGGLWRVDYRTTDENFNALSREPFMILNNAGEMVTSGYVKVDGIHVDGLTHTYDISLYGGMGNIFYHLAYDETGKKMTLADLDYLGGGDRELDYVVKAENIKKAWDALKSMPDVPTSVFHVLNFAPCYNGVPEKGFDANKGIIDPAQMGLPRSQDGFSTINDKCLVTLPKKANEFEVGDMRSYMQRPVLSMWAFLNAIKRECAKYGCEFDYSDLLAGEGRGSFDDSFDDSFDKGQIKREFPKAYSKNLWLTLPMLSKTTGVIGNVPIRFVWNDQTLQFNPILTGILEEQIPIDAVVSGSVSINARGKLENPTTGILSMRNGENCAICFLQMVAYRSEQVVGHSKVYGVGVVEAGKTIQDIADGLSYSPNVSEEIVFDHEGSIEAGIDNNIADLAPTTFDLIPSTGKVDRLEIYITSYHYKVETDTGIVIKIDEGAGFPCYDGDLAVTTYQTGGYVVNQSFKYYGSSAVSYSTMTKKRVLTTKNTPADYLLSYAKMFGLKFLYDPINGKLQMMRRGKFFTGEVVDLSGRVDMASRNYQPYCIASKFYNFTSKGVGGANEKRYEGDYGRQYGNFRVDTNFQFDANENDVLKSVIFKNAVTSLEQGAKYGLYYAGSSPSVPVPYFPSPLIDGGGKYTLFSGKATKEFPINLPSVDVDWFNKDFNGYDSPDAFKVQMHDKTGKELDGSDVLLIYAGEQKQGYAHLSDDSSDMYRMNNGVPCYDLTINPAGLTIPVFVRSFRWDQTENCSLDFGVPSELYAIVNSYPEEATIYNKFWKNYVGDRYSADIKVVRAKVNFEGMQVGQEAMRKFYFFGGQIWQLNRIIDYSLTTDDLTECEFVKVNNPANYAEEL